MRSDLTLARIEQSWTGWRGRAEPGIRFALCWLIPSWLVFELVPTKLPHYTLPCFGAIAWLMAASLTRPLDKWPRWLGAALNLGVAAGFAVVHRLEREDIEQQLTVLQELANALAA